MTPTMTRPVFFAGFSLTLSAALVYYINSSFLGGLVGKDRVGLIYALAASLTLATILWVPILGRHFGLLRPSRWFALIFFGSIVTLATSQTPTVQLLAFVIAYATIVSLGLWLDIYLEALSSDQRTGRIRGSYLTVVNAAVLISPYASGLTLENTADYHTIYLLACLAALPLLYQIFFRLKEKVLPTGHTAWYRKLGEANLRRIIVIDFLLNLFYFFMVVYLPLHLTSQIGFSWENIGFIFTIMLLPFVFIEYPLGWLADLKWGEKEILTGGLIIAAIATAPIAFLTAKNITLWALLLLLTRVGASAIEAMKETYLFKKVTASDVGVISLSRLTVPIAYLLGSLVSLIFLHYFPISYLFLLMSALLFGGLYFSLTLKDTR